MPVKFFGQYLLEKHIIKPHELIKAIEYQESRNLKFGGYALSKGYLSKKDIERIQNEQKNVDMFFGELAVKLNILTPTQVKEILTMQKNDHVLIGEALVKTGLLSHEIVERELNLFKKDQSKYIPDEIIMPDGVENPGIVKVIVDMTQKMLQRIAYLNIKVGEGYINNNEPQKNFLVISIYLRGNHRYEYALSFPYEISKIITSTIIGEEVKSNAREIILDGVKEFCNITCGNIIAKLSQKGKSMDISPPEEIVFSDNGYNLLKGRKAIYYPLASPEGDTTLILIDGE